MKNYSPLPVALIVSMGGFIFGFDASVISGVVGFVSIEFGLSEFQQGVVVGAPTLGAIIASLMAGALSDTLGRKRVLMLIASLYVVSAALSAVAPSYEALALSRLIGGFAFASLIIAPLYIAEISPSHLRGRMVSINQLNIVLGFSAAYFANFFILRLSDGGSGLTAALGIDAYAWRWMLGIELVPAIAYLVLLQLIPESPRWLIINGREQEGRAVLGTLMKGADIDHECKAVKASVGEGQEPLLARLKTLFSSRVRMVLILGIIVGVAQQITGVNAIYFYAPTIFEQSGVGTDAAFAQATLVGIINVIFTIVAMLLIDRLGRKPLLLVGIAGVTISMLVCAYAFDQAKYELPLDRAAEVEQVTQSDVLAPMLGQQYSSDVVFKQELEQRLGREDFLRHQSALLQMATQVNAKLVLAGILGFVASFALSLGPVMWVLLSEIFPNAVRGIAISFVGIVNSAVSFGVQFIFPWELANLGIVVAFSIYGVFALISFGLVVWLLPETKGKSLEQLEEYLGSAAETKHGAVTNPV